VALFQFGSFSTSYSPAVNGHPDVLTEFSMVFIALEYFSDCYLLFTEPSLSSWLYWDESL